MIILFIKINKTAIKNNSVRKTNLDQFMALNVFDAHLIPQNLETYLHQSGRGKGRTDLILRENESQIVSRQRSVGVCRFALKQIGIVRAATIVY